MDTSRSPSHAPQPPSLFSLGSALRWLGHDCPDPHCWSLADTAPAAVWFLRHGSLFRTPLDTMILVDFDDVSLTAAQCDQLLERVNGCVDTDAITVRDNSTRASLHPTELRALRPLQDFVVPPRLCRPTRGVERRSGT